jgi:hypothetical protein
MSTTLTLSDLAGRREIETDALPPSRAARGTPSKEFMSRDRTVSPVEPAANCGSVAKENLRVSMCHCLDCQRQTGSLFKHCRIFRA